MMPKLHSQNFGGMELIRPLYNVREADIIMWKNYNELKFINCACRFVENCAVDGANDLGSKRNEIKKLIATLTKTNPNIALNTFNSVKNINLDAVIGYRKSGDRHSFLDEY